jgi:hypothetical protein
MILIQVNYQYKFNYLHGDSPLENLYQLENDFIPMIFNGSEFHVLEIVVL